MKKILLLLILFSGINSLLAQSGGLSFSLAFPRGEFQSNVKQTGIGGNIEYFFINSSDVVPFSFGANLGYINYGNESRRAPFSNTIPDVTVDVERSNNIVQFQLLFRVETKNTLVRPYLDLLFGGSYLYTSTSIRKEGTNEEVTTSTNFDDFAWNYGAGAGILFKVYEPKSEGELWGPLMVDFKVRFIAGSEAEYLKEGSILVNTTNGTISYTTQKSKTDLLTANLGVFAYFNSAVFNN